MGYVIGWFVVVVATIGLASLVFIALRKFKMIASLIVAIGAFWALCPWEFEAGYYAPIFIVLLFQWLFEPETDVATVAAVGFLGTVGICTLFAAIALLSKIWKTRHRAQTIDDTKA